MEKFKFVAAAGLVKHKPPRKLACIYLQAIVCASVLFPAATLAFFIGRARASASPGYTCMAAPAMNHDQGIPQ